MVVTLWSAGRATYTVVRESGPNEKGDMNSVLQLHWSCE